MEFIFILHAMTDSQTLFMMTAKICHDLSAPLGAMGMGLESVKDGDTDTVNFVYDSYSTLEFKLNYYRTLMMPGDNGPVLSDFVNILNKYAKNKNIKIHWQDVDDETFPKGTSRLLMGFTYIMMEPLIRGGDCYIKVVDAKNIIITSKGPVCPMRDAYKNIFNAKNKDQYIVNTRNIMPAFLISLANDAGYVTQFTEENGEIQLSLSRK